MYTKRNINRYISLGVLQYWYKVYIFFLIIKKWLLRTTGLYLTDKVYSRLLYKKHWNPPTFKWLKLASWHFGRLFHSLVNNKYFWNCMNGNVWRCQFIICRGVDLAKVFTWIFTNALTGIAQHKKFVRKYEGKPKLFSNPFFKRNYNELFK